MSRLLSKVCLVTGASSGIGRATALALASQGAKTVICADLTPSARPEIPSETEIATHELIASRHGLSSATFIQTDMTKSNEVEACIKQAVRLGDGRLDVLVNNVGGGPVGKMLHEVSEEEWEAGLAVNLRSTFLGTRAAVGQFMKQERDAAGQKGVIVNMGSVAGLVGFKGVAAYASAKAGVLSLTRCVALEYGAEGIRCNAICPGGTETALSKPSYDADPASWAGQQPLKAKIMPEEIAAAVVFLASAEAGAVTGVALPVDAGFVCH